MAGWHFHDLNQGVGTRPQDQRDSSVPIDPDCDVFGLGTYGNAA